MYHSSISRIPGVRYIPERAARRRQDRALVFRRRPLGQRRIVPDVRLAEDPEIDEVVLRVKRVLDDRRLPADRVEIKSALGHVPAGRHAGVAFRINEKSPLAVVLEVELPADQHLRAVEELKGLPILVRIPEHCPRAVDRHDIHAHGLGQWLVDLAEHLVRLDHLDAVIDIAQKGLAKPGYGRNIHARHRRAAEIHADPIRRRVGQGRRQPLS
jgi:hypothetical protein